MRRRNGRVLSEVDERDLHVRQGNLTALAQHPAWPTFVDEVERQVTKIEKTVLVKALGAGAFTEVQMEFYRGLVQGLRWLTSAPPNAERRLEQYLQEQKQIAARQEAMISADE